jgi:hypothetical protein
VRSIFWLGIAESSRGADKESSVRRVQAVGGDEGIGREIQLRGNVFTSPSMAVGAASKGVARDGWNLRRYERAPGDWVLLDEMRKR